MYRVVFNCIIQLSNQFHFDKDFPVNAEPGDVSQSVLGTVDLRLAVSDFLYRYLACLARIDGLLGSQLV
jgi:hypothetical protein